MQEPIRATWKLLRIALGLDRFGDLRDRHGGVGRERTVDVRFEFGEVDLDDAVVVLGRVGIDFLVGGEVDLGGEVGNGLTARGGEVAGHGVVVGEDGGRGAHFSTHVADRGLAGGGERGGAFAEELDDAVRGALGAEHAGELEDHVLGGGPALKLAGELDADDLRHLELPFHAHKGVDEVGTAHADGEHAHAAGRRGVGVGHEHHATREVVVFHEDLMADAGAGGPEVKAVAAGDVAQELVRFDVALFGDLEVGNGADVGLNEVVADERCGQCDAFLARGEELNDGHRAADVMRAGAVRAKFDVVDSALEFTQAFRMVEVREEDLFRERERTVERAAHDGELLRVFAIEGLDHVEVADLRRVGSNAIGGHDDGRDRGGGRGGCGADGGCAKKSTTAERECLFLHGNFSLFDGLQMGLDACGPVFHEFLEFLEFLVYESLTKCLDIKGPELRQDAFFACVTSSGECEKSRISFLLGFLRGRVCPSVVVGTQKPV